MFFNGLSSGTYKLKLSKSGYTPQEVNVSISSPWKSQEIILMPE
jgi:hypothetical protein